MKAKTLRRSSHRFLVFTQLSGLIVGQHKRIRRVITISRGFRTHHPLALSICNANRLGQKGHLINIIYTLNNSSLEQ